MSTNEKMHMLLDRLIKLTQAGEADWRKAAEPPAAYELTGPSGEVIRVESRDSDGYAPISLIVCSSDGTVISSLQWTMGRSSDIQSDTDYRLIKLYDLARDHALPDATDALDKLLSELPDPEAATPS